MHLILLYLSIIANLEAKTFIVNLQNQQYNLTVEDNLIQFKGHLMDLSLSSKDCNKHIIKSFRSRLDSVLSRSIVIDSQKNSLELFSVKTDGQENVYLVKSILGDFFKNVSEEMKLLKIEEILNCK